MSTDARAMRIHEAVHSDWETGKEPANANFSKERMVEAGVRASTATILGGVLSSFLKAMENYAMIGTPPF